MKEDMAKAFLISMIPAALAAGLILVNIARAEPVPVWLWAGAAIVVEMATFRTDFLRRLARGRIRRVPTMAFCAVMAGDVMVLGAVAVALLVPANAHGAVQVSAGVVLELLIVGAEVFGGMALMGLVDREARKAVAHTAGTSDEGARA